MKQASNLWCHKSLLMTQFLLYNLIFCRRTPLRENNIPIWARIMLIIFWWRRVRARRENSHLIWESKSVCPAQVDAASSFFDVHLKTRRDSINNWLRRANHANPKYCLQFTFAQRAHNLHKQLQPRRHQQLISPSICLKCTLHTFSLCTRR